MGVKHQIDFALISRCLVEVFFRYELHQLHTLDLLQRTPPRIIYNLQLKWAQMGSMGKIILNVQLQWTTMDSKGMHTYILHHTILSMRYIEALFFARN
jgi:hypothetical protein